MNQQKKIQILNPGCINSYNQLPNGKHVSILHMDTTGDWFKFEMSNGEVLYDIFVYRWMQINGFMKCEAFDKSSTARSPKYMFNVPYNTFRKKSSFQDHLIDWFENNVSNGALI